MINIPDSIKKLIDEYEAKYKKKPRGWYYKEESLTEYEEYLKKELDK